MSWIRCSLKLKNMLISPLRTDLSQNLHKLLSKSDSLWTPVTLSRCPDPGFSLSAYRQRGQIRTANPLMPTIACIQWTQIFFAGPSESRECVLFRHFWYYLSLITRFTGGSGAQRPGIANPTTCNLTSSDQQITFSPNLGQNAPKWPQNGPWTAIYQS